MSFSENHMEIRRRKATKSEIKDFESAGIYERHISDDLSYLLSDEESEKLFRQTVLDVLADPNNDN